MPTDWDDRNGNDDYKEYHQRVAARLRSAVEHSTTKAIKVRLIAVAEADKRIAWGEMGSSRPPISSPLRCVRTLIDEMAADGFNISL